MEAGFHERALPRPFYGDKMTKIHKSIRLEKGMFIKKEFFHGGKPVKIIFQITNISEKRVKKKKVGYFIIGLLYYSDNPKHSGYLFNDRDDSPIFRTTISFEEIKKKDAKYFIMDEAEALLYKL